MLSSNASTSITDFVPLLKIGEGSFSSVYKVRRISDNSTYALKKVKMGPLKEKERQNSLNQIRILASLSSNNIVQYREAFFDQHLNLLCIVMEWANEGDLQKRVESHRKSITRFDEKEIWKAAYHTVSGLNMLHRHSILHRDIKSANIFISDGIYKLGDLNVSKVQNRVDRLAYTQTGTPYYASPEVWRDEPYDSKSDIWSLGCILYEMCCLRPPFKGRDLEELFKQVQKGVYDPIPLHYSKALGYLISSCLKQNARDRLSCQDMLETVIHRKCLEQGIELLEQEASEELLKTIKLPFNLKDLKKKLPKSKYESSKNIIKMNECRQSSGPKNPESSHSKRQHKQLVEKISRQKATAFVDNKVGSKKNISMLMEESIPLRTKEHTPNDQIKLSPIKKLCHDQRVSSERNQVRKISQLRKLSQKSMANQCSSQRHPNIDCSLKQLAERVKDSPRCCDRRMSEKKEESMDGLQRKVELKRKQLKRIGSIKKMSGGKSSRHEPSVNEPPKKSTVSLASILFKSPSSTEDGRSYCENQTYSQRRIHLEKLRHANKVSSTPYLVGLCDAPRIRKILDRASKEPRHKLSHNRLLKYPDCAA